MFRNHHLKFKYQLKIPSNNFQNFDKKIFHS